MCESCRSRQELSVSLHVPFSQSSFRTRQLFKRVFTCKLWLRYSREPASQSLPQTSQPLEKQVDQPQAKETAQPPAAPRAPGLAGRAGQGRPRAEAHAALRARPREPRQSTTTIEPDCR